MRQLVGAYNSLRCQQLYVTYVNLVYRNVIFTWKLFCIGSCIVNGYAAIAHFTDDPIFGVMYCVIFFDDFIIYALLYGAGFKVAVLFEKTKTILTLHARKGVGGADWKILKRQVRSIAKVGIQVGHFHMLERTCTPVFLHYVLVNIVNMLVAYG